MKDGIHETIADIVAEIRKRAEEVYEGQAGYPESWKDQMNRDEICELADRIEVAAKREREAGAELRKCLKATVGEKCSMCAYIDNEMSAFYGKPVCGNKVCKYKRWRKALETMEGYAE